jgi:uncharacterized protein
MTIIENHVKTLEEIKSILKTHYSQLENKYYIKRLGIFGSYARGKQKKSSDIDILVEFCGPVGLFRFIELEHELKSLLGIKIDLVTRDALKPGIDVHILREVQYLE